MSNSSVLIVDRAVVERGVLANVAFVLGLTVGRCLPATAFGPDVVDGDGDLHIYLTCIGHIVRKAGQSKIRRLRAELAGLSDVQLVDYPEDAGPADYSAYSRGLGARRGEEIQYRAIHVYGPSEQVDPRTKNLSRL